MVGTQEIGAHRDSLGVAANSWRAVTGREFWSGTTGGVIIFLEDTAMMFTFGMCVVAGLGLHFGVVRRVLLNAGLTY